MPPPPPPPPQGDPGDAKNCVRLLDSFEHPGPHGTHVCEVFGVMGDDLLTLIRWVLIAETIFNY